MVHILVQGEIKATGGPELADELEQTGYAAYTDGADEPADTPPDPFADPFGPGPFS